MDSGKVTISWSGGKDSYYSLVKLLKAGVTVAEVFTIVDAAGIAGMHGTSASLLRRQCEALGLRLEVMVLPAGGNASFARALVEYCAAAAGRGITDVAFGDLHLEDLKRFRQATLEGTGMNALFPLWGAEPHRLVHEMIHSGMETMICSCNEGCFKAGVLGQVLDEALVARLPAGTDPCGENGEYHSFVTGGPGFRSSLRVDRGVTTESIYADPVTGDHVRFYFQELLP